MSRIENSIRNMKITVTGQLVALLVSFISRTVFIRILGSEYLGLSGLFTNILSVLSLAELGINTAIMYSLYEPLAKQDHAKIRAIMSLFAKVYTLICVTIGLVGTALTPFLGFLIKERPNIDGIEVYYLLFVLNLALSYLAAYKRLLLFADQKKYIDSIYHFLTASVLNVVQISVLLLTANYFLFLMLNVVATVTENLLITTQVNRLYPFLKTEKARQLDKQERSDIFKNIKAVFMNRIGYTIINGTDNIVISKFIGLVAVGLYSNYLLITTSVNRLIAIFYQSIIGSVGNVGATESKDKISETFRNIDFIGFWIYGFSAISLLILVNPFIRLWIGEPYQLDNLIVLIIAVNFYLQGNRMSLQIFKESLGLLWYDRYRPILESALNLAISLLLVTQYGIAGVLLGTILSTLMSSFWIEPWVLYKYGMTGRLRDYFLAYARRFLLVLSLGAGMTWIAWKMVFPPLIQLVLLAALCLILPNLVIYLAYRKTSEMITVMQIMKKSFKLRD